MEDGAPMSYVWDALGHTLTATSKLYRTLLSNATGGLGRKPDWPMSQKKKRKKKKGNKSLLNYFGQEHGKGKLFSHVASGPLLSSLEEAEVCPGREGTAKGQPTDGR